VLTSQLKKVIVLQAVDGLELAADIVLVRRVEEVLHSRVLLISTKDFLGLDCSVLVALLVSPAVQLLPFAWQSRKRLAIVLGAHLFGL
jgi:hypothetical protein